VSEVRFHADEHIARLIVGALRFRGIDVTTVTEAGLLGASDLEHLAFARRERRMIITRDADFLRLAASGHEHSGIVFAAQDVPAGRVIRHVLLIHGVLTSEECDSVIEFV
jgi:predicted nuclease of predicted toxin-antitoxin system